MKPMQVTELIALLHAYSPATLLTKMAMDADMYASPGPELTTTGATYSSQAEVAWLGLAMRDYKGARSWRGVDVALLQILRTLSNARNIGYSNDFLYHIGTLVELVRGAAAPLNAATWPTFVSLARRLAERLAGLKRDSHPTKEAIDALNSWADSLEHTIAAQVTQQPKSRSKSTSKSTSKRTTRKKPTGRK